MPSGLDARASPTPSGEARRPLAVGMRFEGEGYALAALDIASERQRAAPKLAPSGGVDSSTMGDDREASAV